MILRPYLTWLESAKYLTGDVRYEKSVGELSGVYQVDMEYVQRLNEKVKDKEDVLAALRS